MHFQWKKEWMIPTITGIVSFGLGGVAGYILAKRKSTYLIEEISEERDQAEAVQLVLDYERDQYSGMLQAGRKLVNEMAIEIQNYRDHRESEVMASKQNHPAFQNIRGDNLEVIENDELVAIPDTIFKDPGDEVWDMEAELPGRGPEHPYIIHHDEFYNKEEEDFSQTTLTYYKGDDILCDEHDTPIYGHEKIVGELKFGHGSLDPSIVYIRNEKLEAEYEVLLEHGYFQTEVLGQELEDNLNNDVKHSVRKFRRD